MYILFLDAEGDVVIKNGRAPWYIALTLMKIGEIPIYKQENLISEGMGLYSSRLRDQKKLQASGLPILYFDETATKLKKITDPLIAKNETVVAMSWGNKDFAKLGKNFFSTGIQFADGIESWAKTCPSNYSAPKTKSGKIGTTLKNVHDFEIGGDFDWHNAAADVSALISITAKSMTRGAEIVLHADWMNFHRCPAQIAWNRMAA